MSGHACAATEIEIHSDISGTEVGMCSGRGDKKSQGGGMVDGGGDGGKGLNYVSEEEEMGTIGGGNKLLVRFLRRTNELLRKLPLNEAGEEVMSLGKIACPILLTTLLIYSRSVISMLYMTHLGKAEMAGGSLAISFGNITGLSLHKGLSMGMEPICGQAYGAKRWSVLSQTYLRTLCLLLVSSIPISILWLNVEPIFLLLGQDSETTNVAKVYMAALVPELIAQALLNPMRTLLRTQGLTTPLTIASFCSLLMHPFINYFFAIYLQLGVTGVALAVACNTFNLNIGLLLYVSMSKTPIKPWHGVTSRSLFEGWRPLLGLALPSLVQVCLEWWWYEIMLFLCGLLSNPVATVSAMGILIQTTALLYSTPYAISGGITTRVSQALGAGQPSRAQWTSLIGLVMALAFGVSAFIFMTVLRSAWGKMYTDEPEILDLITSVLPILGLCEIANSPQTAACGVLAGTARPKEGVNINLCSFYLVGLPVAVLMAFKFKMGFQGMWFGLLAAQFCCLSMMLYTLIKTDWKHQAKRAEELTAAAGGKSDLEAGLLTTEDRVSA